MWRTAFTQLVAFTTTKYIQDGSLSVELDIINIACAFVYDVIGDADVIKILPKGGFGYYYLIFITKQYYLFMVVYMY